MMDQIWDFLGGFSLQTIITLGGMMWYFGRHIEQKIEKIEIDLKQQGARTDRRYEMFIDLLKDGKK
jgi:uncharacterized protein YdgA (DUF945 family)